MVYSLATLMGAAAILIRNTSPHPGSPSSRPGPAWIIFTMLIVVTVCMITERGQWRLVQRIGFVFLAWAGAGLLVIPISLPLIAISPPIPRGPEIPTFLSALAVVVLSMRRSRWFVTPHSMSVARE